MKTADISPDHAKWTPSDRQPVPLIRLSPRHSPTPVVSFYAGYSTWTATRSPETRQIDAMTTERDSSHDDGKSAGKPLTTAPRGKPTWKPRQTHRPNGI